MEWIIVVVLFNAVTVKTLNVKQTAMKEFELLSRMVRALREACDE
jgi:hypothetical protein